MASLPLELRENPTAWRELLDRALPALDYVFANEIVHSAKPHWTLGGGTAIALRIAHRLSDDVDIFAPGGPLKRFAPANNPAARNISANFQWPGHYLKFECGAGEIDFLSPHLQTEPGFTLEIFRDREIALETLDEVIVKKIRFRAAQFTSRDIFDLAAVGRHEKDLCGVLAREVGDALARLRAVVQARAQGLESMTIAVRPTAPFQAMLASAHEEALAIIDAAIALGK